MIKLALLNKIYSVTPYLNNCLTRIQETFFILHHFIEPDIISPECWRMDGGQRSRALKFTAVAQRSSFGGKSYQELFCKDWKTFLLSYYEVKIISSLYVCASFRVIYLYIWLILHQILKSL